MGRLVSFLAIAAIAAPTAAYAGASCPHQAGAPYPWTNSAFMSGDKWADVELDLDAKGKATACRVIKSNMDREDNFWVCGAMQVQGEYDPVAKDGVAVAGTIHRKMTMPGSRHREADMAARKKWFREHPQERWDCYPE